ncbi:MAG: InlB B-repeat-containing protein [Verrucomicrobiota bacterium]
MKLRLLTVFFLLAGASLHAQSTTTGYPSDQVITIPTPAYDIRFSVVWFADDYPQNSAPGRIELMRDGVVVGRVTASHYRDSGPSVSVTNGTVDNVSSSVDIFTVAGTPADGFLYATWHLTGLAPGTYTVRAWTYRTDDRRLYATTVWTDTSFEDGYSPQPANRAPSIAWTAAPANAGSGQGYTVTARGHDDDGNLTQVNVWKNGQPFAFAGGGNGTDGDSGNLTSDAGPQTVTFTAQATDASGTTSPLITHVVTIDAPVNVVPTVTLLSPGSQTVTAGTTLTISARATDPDGNLSGHNLDIQRPAGDWNFQGGFATGEPYQGGPVGSGGDSTRTASFTFSDVGTYYVRSGASDGSGWYHSATVAITVTPANRAPTIAWNTTPGTVASGQGYTVSAHGHDDDGNLTQVNVWKNGQPFAFAGGGNGSDGDSGNTTGDTGPQTITFTAQAADGAGATSAVISQTVTVSAPPPVQYTLTTSAGTGGSVSAGGIFDSGSTAIVTAMSDAMHDFAGWSGDAAGSVNPLGLLMDRSKSVQATFTLKLLPLSTSASTGGSVTSGGSYPYGTVVTLTAAPDSTHRFTGWSGDAGGTAPSIAVTMNGPKTVQAVFADKFAQTITFPAPGDQPVGGSPLTLAAAASSGMPVTYTVLSGPAVVNGDQIQVIGPGAVTVQASQAGDADYLPTTVSRTFNAFAAAVLRYRPNGRTLLQGRTTQGATPYVLEKP